MLTRVPAGLCHQGLPAFLRGAHLPPSMLTLLPASCWVLGPLLSPGCGREGHCRGEGLRPCPCSSRVAPFKPPLWRGPREPLWGSPGPSCEQPLKSMTCREVSRPPADGDGCCGDPSGTESSGRPSALRGGVRAKEGDLQGTLVWGHLA